MVFYSSEDLYNWKDEGFAVAESEDPANPFHPKNIMDRPHILFNQKTKKYVLWAKTAHEMDFGRCSFSICVGDSLQTMSFVKEIIPHPYRAGDFDLFEYNGKGYVVYENPHTELVVHELTDDYMGVTDRCSTHFQAPCPPFVREAPAVFERNGRLYMLTSGTTGYYPNATEVADITDIHGEWKNLGKICRNDNKNNSFHAQFSDVFRHPTKEDTYIALGDRWLTDLTEDLPNMEDVFYKMCGPSPQPVALAELSDENTSRATYVWLQISFDGDLPYIEWKRSWKL